MAKRKMTIRQFIKDRYDNGWFYTDKYLSDTPFVEKPIKDTPLPVDDFLLAPIKITEPVLSIIDRGFIILIAVSLLGMAVLGQMS